MIKKVVGGSAAVLLIALLTAAAAGFITWRLFWFAVIPFAALAYWILPYFSEQED